MGSSRFFRWLPRTSMPRSVALAGRGGGASPSASSPTRRFAGRTSSSSGSRTKANSHAWPPSQVSGMTRSGSRRGSGCTTSRPDSQSIARCVAADRGLTTIREIVRRSTGSGRPTAPAAAAPTSCSTSERSWGSSCSSSTSSGPITTGFGLPVALPATSSCIRDGTMTAARASADAARSSTKVRAPPARRWSGIIRACDRTAGSTSRRRSSSSAAQPGRRWVGRRIDGGGVQVAASDAVGSSPRASSVSSVEAGSSVDPASGTSSATMWSVTGV